MDYLDSPDDFWQEPDVVLGEIVATLVNVMQMPIGITLFTKGAVLSGTLVSENEYLQVLSDTFKAIVEPGLKDADPEVARNILELVDFKPFAEGFTPPEDDEDEDDDEITDSVMGAVRHLHLKDVVMMTPYPPLAFDQAVLPVLRLRLTMIDAWILGQAVKEDLPDFPDEGEVLH